MTIQDITDIIKSSGPAENEIIEEKQKALYDAFDFVNSINSNKDIFKDNPNETKVVEKYYCPFVTNKAFSYYPDTIFYANEMNKYSCLDAIEQYMFYLNAMRQRKRYSKWYKPIKNENIDMIQKKYGLSRRKAEISLECLSEDQLLKIKKSMNTGGETAKRKIK